MDPLNIEHWYPKVKDYTIPTTFVELTRDEAQAIVHYHEDPNGKYKKFTKTSQQHLKKLEYKLHKIIKEYNGAFIRLSTRSPKDAHKNLDKVEALVRKNLKEKLFKDNENLCLVHSFHQALKVTSGAEAVDLLLHSKRAYHDCFRRLLVTDDKSFKMIVAVRKWVNIYPGFEFRGFVYRGKLNALTQYFEAIYLPELVNSKKNVEASILHLFDKIQPFLEIPAYVIDFAMLDTGRIIMVELNHFEKTTGTGLFDKREYNKFGKFQIGPYEFRIIDDPKLLQTRSEIYKPLANVLRKVKGLPLLEDDDEQIKTIQKPEKELHKDTPKTDNRNLAQMKKLFILLLFALFHALLAQEPIELQLGVEQVGDVSRFRFNYYYFNVANISWNPNADHVMIMLSQVSGESNLFVSLQEYPQNRSCPHCVKRTGPGLHYVTVDRVDWGNKERFYIGVEGFDFRARYKLTMWVTGTEDSHIVLEDGETKAAYTKDGDHYTYFKFELKEVTPFLKITLSPRGESDDPDMFVSTKTKLPTSTDYEWKQTGWGPDWLELPNAQPATYYIGVKAFLTDAYFTIVCETDRAHVLLLEGIPIAAQVSGTAGNTADEFYKFYVSEKQSIGGRPDVHLSVDGAGDPKVYIYQSRTKVYPSPRLYHWKREQGTETIVIENAAAGWYWVAVRDRVGNRYRISVSGEWSHVDLSPGHQLTDQYVDEDSARFFRFHNLDDENGITFSVRAEPSWNADVQVWLGDMRRPHKDAPGAIKLTKQLDNHFIHLPPLTRIGDYFIGVWSYGGDAFFTISVTVNQTILELYDGEVSYGHHVPKNAYRYFWFDTRSHTKKLDFLISTRGFGDLIIYSAQHPNTNPTSEKYTWRSNYQPYSANEHIYISSSDPLRTASPEFFFGVKGIEDSWFSIVVELLDEITEVRDNTPVTGYVNERKPGESKIPLKHYKFKLPYQRDFSLHASIVIRTPGTSANIIANIGNEEAGMEPPTFEKCDFSNEDDPNYCYMANEGENYLYIEKKGVWDEDTVMFGIYSTGGNVTFEFTVRRGYYTILPDDFSENIITLDPGEEMTFHTEVSDWSWYDYSKSPVIVALTLVNGKTELYLTSNETGSVNPKNAIWESKFWPGNVIYVDRQDPNFKNGIWSFTVKALEESDFHINVIRFKSWFALNVPRIGLAPKNGLVMYTHLTWDTTRDYLLTIRVYSGSVEVYADYTWYDEVPSKEHSKWKSLDKGIGERSIILSKNDTEYDTLTIAVFGNQDIESIFEIMLSYVDEPRYLHSTVPTMGTLKPESYDYYEVLNPSGYSTKYRVEFESCDTQLPGMYLSTTTKKPGPDDYNFTAGPVFGYKMAIDALIEDSAFYVSVGGAASDISYRLVAYSDKKYYPTPSSKEIFDDSYDYRKKQLTVFIKGASSPIVPVTSLTYEAYIRKVENPQPGAPVELNMETSCGIKKYANGSTIVPGQEGGEPIKIVLNDIDYYSVYAMNIIVYDTYGNADSYQPQWIISGKLHDFNGGVFPIILPDFPIPIGGYIILGLAILFTSYMMIGMCINYMNGARGVKVIPQSYFWINLPQYCWEGLYFCITCGRAKYSYYDASLNQDTHTGVDQDEEYSTAVGGYGAI